MIFLTRELRLSFTSAPAPGPDNTWAGAPAAVVLAPYLLLRATLCGSLQPITGYLCDIKVMDDILRRAIQPLTESSAPVSAEALLLAVWRALPTEFVPGAYLAELQLLPTPYTRFTLCRENPEMIQYTEQFEFAAAHRLHCPEYSDEHNRTLFGKCNNPHGHGHNYVVEVTIAGSPQGCAARGQLGEVVKERILDRFDHKHLNEDCAEFRACNPTVENIARVVWDLLVGVTPASLVKVRVYETPKTWAEVQSP